MSGTVLLRMPCLVELVPVETVAVVGAVGRSGEVDEDVVEEVSVAGEVG